MKTTLLALWLASTTIGAPAWRAAQSDIRVTCPMTIGGSFDLRTAALKRNADGQHESGIWLKFSPQFRSSGGQPGFSNMRLAFEADLLPRTHWNVGVSFYQDNAF